MDIYTMDNKEGLYVSTKLDLLRLENKKSNINIISEKDNPKLKQVKNIFILDKHTYNVLKTGLKYFFCVDKNDIFFHIIFEDFCMVYSFNENTNWKVVNLDIIDKDSYESINANQSYSFNKVATSCLMISVTLACKYGFDRVFDIGHENFSQFVALAFQNIDEKKVIHGKESEYAFSLIKTRLKKEFTETFMPYSKYSAKDFLIN